VGKLFFVVCIIVVAPATSVACSPDTVRSNIDDAASYLRRAARADSVDDAQSAARRAQSSLEDVESGLRNCNCAGPASDFDDAARFSRRARYEDNPSELSDYLRRAIRAFNSGVDGINSGRCR
jgi:hypothetical protein